MHSPLLADRPAPGRGRWVAAGFAAGVAATAVGAAVAVYATGPGAAVIAAAPVALASPKEKDYCASPDYRSTTLKTAVDATVFGLLHDNLEQYKFEASGVVLQDNGFYVVCDSSWAIPVFHDLSTSGAFKATAVQTGNPNDAWKNEALARNFLVMPDDPESFPKGVDSQWEAITYSTSREHFIAVQESILFPNGEYHAVLSDIIINGTKWSHVRSCRSEFPFDSDNKGFEGALAIHGVNGEAYILGLCEGNHCDFGKRGREKGNGKLVLMQRELGTGPENVFRQGQFTELSDDPCVYKTIGVYDLPSSADFLDYSDIARRGDKIAFTSQESSALYVADMVLENGLVNPATFKVQEGTTYRFRPDDDCDIVYCNVEAIDFVTDRLLVGASDQMKGHGKQPFQCLEKDQSMHVFVMPDEISPH